MTIPETFIAGYTFIGVLAFLCGRLSRDQQIHDLRQACTVYRNLTQRSIDLVCAYREKTLRTTDRPRDKKTGRFQ